MVPLGNKEALLGSPLTQTYWFEYCEKPENFVQQVESRLGSLQVHSLETSENKQSSDKHLARSCHRLKPDRPTEYESWAAISGSA